MTPHQAALRGAALTVLTLFGGLLFGLMIGDLVFHLIPGSSLEDIKPGHAASRSMFVPSAFIIAGFSASAIGRTLRNPILARSLFWRVGLTAALIFSVVNLMMEFLGWVIGAPNAAERATMVTVLALGIFATAITSGAVMGWILTRKNSSVAKNIGVG